MGRLHITLWGRREKPIFATTPRELEIERRWRERILARERSWFVPIILSAPILIVVMLTRVASSFSLTAGHYATIAGLSAPWAAPAGITVLGLWLGPRYSRWWLSKQSRLSVIVEKRAFSQRRDMVIALLIAPAPLIVICGLSIFWADMGLLRLFAACAVVAFSIAAILWGLGHRVGYDERCRACGYRHTEGAERCPECNSDLTKPLAVVLGRDVRSTAAALIGVVAFVAAIGVVMLG
tara:strand:+ start:66 stop:779 length:714 start_codon:yes stop_codon:yes gene_type:complete